MAADPNPDLIQAAKPLLPSLVGVVFGMFARWSREAKAGRVKSFRRMMLLDCPTLGALTLAAGSVAQRMDADPLTTAGIGCAAGYVGIEVLNAFVSWRLKAVAAPTQGP